MYPVSDYARRLLSQNYRQVIRITAGDLVLTGDDIAQNSFSVDRYCSSGSTVEIGSACAAELSFELDNRDGRFDDVNFDGLEVAVEVGVKKWDAYYWEKAQIEYIPCGAFTIDKPPRRLSTISLTGLDGMVKFDRSVDDDFWVAGETVGNMVLRMCKVCSVVLSTDVSSLTNSGFVLGARPESDDLTYRALLQYAAQITGTCAYIDWNGQLRLEWYGDAMLEDCERQSIGLGDRFSSELGEALVSITGVAIDIGDDVTYLAGDDKYAILLEGNPLLSAETATDVAKALWNKVRNFTYLPFECETDPQPYLWPLDLVQVQDKAGNWHKSIATHVHVTVNGNTAVKAIGETSTEQSYARSSPITTGQAMSSQRSSKRVEKAAESLTEMIVNSMGLYFAKEQLSNGSYRIFAYDKHLEGNTLEENLRQSTIVYMVSAGGVAWTTHWDGDNTQWQYGVDRDANAVLNTLIANKISADCFEGKIISSEGGESWLNLEDGTFNFGNGKFAMGIDGIVKLVGKIQSNNGKFSATIGASETGGGQAFTVTDETHGDLFQTYTVLNEAGEIGIVWTAPFLNGNNGKSRKGVAIFPSEIGLFADKDGMANASVTLNLNTGQVLINGVDVINEYRTAINKVYDTIYDLADRVSDLEAK